ncbi:hypothetical protein PBCV1_A543L [Paramecium bursaria Chlorella virus 1]|uniref:Uncharacterized protein n=1 Tax=Paramecium bursaria Chlorella virus 1 TaxID=10506 RepID=O41025_PBCV1|nr:hypothetical protein PBCV1_A543L [Paramecium bursaria Chlorella virus 1]AAC96908.2 hypothetical protein [Paramecium bursaria Chlorella virus 1]
MTEFLIGLKVLESICVCFTLLMPSILGVAKHGNCTSSIFSSVAASNGFVIAIEHT